MKPETIDRDTLKAAYDLLRSIARRPAETNPETKDIEEERPDRAA